MSIEEDYVLSELIELQRGNTYQGKLLGDNDGPKLLGLVSIAPHGGFRNDKLRSYSGESDPRWLIKKGEIYVSLKDITQEGLLLGAVAQVPDYIEIGRITQDVVHLKFKDDTLPKKYVYWILRTPQYRKYCRSVAIGTTNLSLQRDDFLNVRIPKLTPLRNILFNLIENLDKKITLLRQQNQTLEELAQTLFKRWFVEFEFPNENGEPYKSSGGKMV